MNCRKPGIQKPHIPIVLFTSGLAFGKPKRACPPQMKYPVPRPKKPIATGTNREAAKVNDCVSICSPFSELNRCRFHCSMQMRGGPYSEDSKLFANSEAVRNLEIATGARLSEESRAA